MAASPEPAAAVAAAAAQATVGGKAAVFLPRDGGGGVGPPERCELRGSRGSVEPACQRILLSAPPVRSPPPPRPPLSSPSLDSLFNLPFALVSPVRGRSGGNGTGPTILQALLPQGARIGLTDLAIKIQDAS